jgi:hypothetical protein
VDLWHILYKASVPSPSRVLFDCLPIWGYSLQSSRPYSSALNQHSGLCIHFEVSLSETCMCSLGLIEFEHIDEIYIN